MGPKHHGLTRPGIRFVATATASDAAVSFANAQAGDFLHYSIGRTSATPPALPAGWQEIVSAWSVAAPAYNVHWWRYFQPGDTDPLPAELGRKRLRIYRGARLKAGSAVTAVNSGTAMSIPARSCAKDVFREWSAYNLYCRAALADLDPYAPAGTTRRFALENITNNHIGGDTAGANAGWAQTDFTLSAATNAYAVAYVLEPRNS